MKQKANVQLSMYEIIWNNGKVEHFVWTGQQAAGFKRRKGIKKQYITLKRIAAISLTIKSTL